VGLFLLKSPVTGFTYRETALGPKGRKMDRKITFKQAINEALAQEMERDKTVILMGEDVAGGSGTDGQMDAWGGVLGVTKGLWDLYGDRVMDTPITESAFVGAAIGAATAGLRPVVELMFVDFMGVCFDQIYNQAAKFRYMFGGKAVTPLVVRTMMGAGFRAAAQHSQALYPIFTHIPGLKCVVPSTPYDAKGLLIQAIRDDDPVIFFEHKMLYALQGQVPEEPYAIPFGEANYVREGNDVTIVTLARMVHVASEAANLLAKEGIECEILDLRTTSPLDEDSILESVEKTGRLVVVDEASPRCNMATDVSALVAQKSFRSLKAPIRMVTPPHTPVPFSDVLEDEYLPNPEKVAAAVQDVMRYKA
jgi:pyruvate dehydrogenase E1 component beta subunit